MMMREYFNEHERNGVVSKRIFFLIFTCYVYHLLFENEWDKHLNSSMMKGTHGIATCTSSALMFQKILLKFSSRFSSVNSIHRVFISDPRNEDSSLSEKPLFFITLPAGMNWIARQNTPLSRNAPESVGLRPM